MTVLNVLRYPSAALTTPTETVTVFDAELKKLADNMFETMKHHKGIGLAANQVGINKRILVCNMPDYPQPWDDKDLVFVNPEIVATTGTLSSREGCLSFPDMYEFVPRSEAVSVRYQDIEGQVLTIEATGLLALVLQHEIDHLQGKTFMDRMSRLKRGLFVKKMEKAWWL